MAKLKNFEVLVKKTVERVVTVKAHDIDDAIDKASNEYDAGNIQLEGHPDTDISVDCEEW